MIAKTNEIKRMILNRRAEAGVPRLLAPRPLRRRCRLGSYSLTHGPIRIYCPLLKIRPVFFLPLNIIKLWSSYTPVHSATSLS